MSKWISIFIGSVLAVIAIIVLAVFNALIWHSGMLGFVLGFAFAGFSVIAFVSYGIWDDYYQ